MTPAKKSPHPPDPAADADPLVARRDLLDRFRAGNERALAEVFTLYVDVVARTLRRGVTVRVDGAPLRLGPDLGESDVEQLVQETFLRAFKESARLSYDGLRPYGAYLCTIARNCLIDLGRRRSVERRVFVDRDDQHLDAPDQGPSPAEAAHEREMHAALRAFLDGLDEADRALVDVRFVRGESLRVAAKTLGTSVFRLRKRDVRIRRALLAFLRQRGLMSDATVHIGGSVLDRRHTDPEPSRKKS